MIMKPGLAVPHSLVPDALRASAHATLAPSSLKDTYFIHSVNVPLNHGWMEPSMEQNDSLLVLFRQIPHNIQLCDTVADG
jgi:hypothetical protein